MTQHLACLHSLEGFFLDMLKLILPETIIVIKKAYARVYLPALIRYFYCVYLTRPPDFLSQCRNLAGATQIIKIIKIESQVAPAEEAVTFPHLVRFSNTTKINRTDDGDAAYV